MKEHQVHIWEEIVTIPTYETGAPNRNPMFLEKRVYQGSSGAVYPHPVIDKIHDHKVDKEYEVVFLENDYLKIMVMPSLGGRVQMAYDKQHDYHFVYYNQVIKPALVGLAGPWISGGIEFNWPQHHRPSTFDAVDYSITSNEDGSKTLWVSEVELMTRTKGMAGFTLHPDSAYLEIKAQVYNRTDEPRTFLWWANPALAVHDHYQSIFPPDVHAVMDHGKRDVSKFPIADGTYYKMDYSAGVDISRYKNLKVPTSYMVYASDYDFIGGYDHAKEAGMLHVADHHVVPGKKQWVWGSGDFGIAWDRNLTDEDGPYAELMTGAFTDNQPDFTWLQPYEEKQFTQYFMPYYGIGAVQQADKYRALSLEVENTTINAGIYVSTAHEQITLRISARSTQTKGTEPREITLKEETISLAAQQVYTLQTVLPEGMTADALTFGVYKDEELLLSYTRETEAAEVEMPEPATAAPAPQEIAQIEELFITGLHIEQYRHATRRADDYYREALKRDPSDSRCCTALGRRLIARGRFTEAEELLRRAVERLTFRNPNPSDGEAIYHLGRTLFYQQRYDEAYRCFYKAIWCDAQKSSGFYHLALIDCRRGEYTTALGHLQQSLDSSYRNHTARDLASTVLRKLSRTNDALQMSTITRTLDRGDWGALYELSLHSGSTDELRRLMRASDNNYLELSLEYSRAGLIEDALQVLELLIEQKPLTKCSPLISYHRAYLLYRMDRETGRAAYQAAQEISPHGCFPSKLESLIVLQEALDVHPADSRAHYYLGNAHYALQNHDEAMGHWEQSLAIDSSFPTAHRNLALAYMNKRGDQKQCELLLTRAFDLDTSDARVLYELDQFRKITNVPAEERLATLQAHMSAVTDRDDLYLEYITLLNQLAGMSRPSPVSREDSSIPGREERGKCLRSISRHLPVLRWRVSSRGNTPRPVTTWSDAGPTPITWEKVSSSGRRNRILTTSQLLPVREQETQNRQNGTTPEHQRAMGCRYRRCTTTTSLPI